MNFVRSPLKPTSIFLIFLVLLAPAFNQMVSATMIGTEMMLTAERHQNTRDYLHDLMSREDIRQVLMARGIDLLEANARIDSLSDEELEMLAGNIADLPAGGNATGFVIIVGAVIIILVLLVEYFSEVKMFSLESSDE